MRALVASTALLAALLASCARGAPEEEPADLADAAPEYVVAAEALTSLIATELGPLSGPPTPGALVGHPCVRLVCAAEAGGDGVRLEKKVLGCTTAYGRLHGIVRNFAGGSPELTGCATSVGPPSFKSWPPTRGRFTIEIGGTETAKPGESTLDRSQGFGWVERRRGSARVEFNGTERFEVNVDQWASVSETGRTVKYHLTSTPGLTMRLERFADWVPRIFDGAILMADVSRSRDITVSFENLAYRKDSCCHPLEGSLAVSCEHELHPGTYILRFSPVCGEATLIDPLGRSSSVRLPGCSS
jgi:hypothetical protein